MIKKSKGLTFPSADNVEGPEPSYSAGAKLHNQFGKFFDSILKVKYRTTTLDHILLLCFTQNKKKYMPIQRFVRECFICNNLKLETQIFIRVNGLKKMWYIHIMEYNLFQQ